VVDSNYGWDAKSSIFLAHYPGMYFFTFSVKADHSLADDFMYVVRFGIYILYTQTTSFMMKILYDYKKWKVTPKRGDLSPHLRTPNPGFNPGFTPPPFI
jgi:hypothetical protein